MTSSARSVLLTNMLTALLICLILPSFAFAQLPSGNPGDVYVFPGESPVAPDGTYQQGGPSISGNIVFWTAYDSSIGKTRIFFKDLSLGPAEPGHVLIDGQANANTPAVNLQGNRIVFAERYGTSQYLYYRVADASGDFTTCTGTVDQCAVRLAPGYYWQEYPSISPDGSKIAWEYGRSHGSQIHIYDFNTGVVEELYPMPGGDQEFPSVDNEWVVWQDKRDFNSFLFPLDQHIYAKRIGNSDPPITIADNRYSHLASVGSAKLARNPQGEPVVVYLSSTEDRYGRDTYDIRLHNLANGADQSIYSKTGDLRSPSIDGDKVVWLDCTDNLYCNVDLHDLSTGVTQVISQNPDLGANKPSVSSSTGFIVWRTARLAPTTIYYNRIGDTAQQLANKYAPELHF